MVTWEQTPERQVRRSCVDSPRKSVLGEGTSPKALNWNTPGRFQEQELSERSRRATGTEGHRETRVPTAALGAPFCCQRIGSRAGALSRENGGRRKHRSLALRSRASARARATEPGAAVHLASSVKRNPSGHSDGQDAGRGWQGEPRACWGSALGIGEAELTTDRPGVPTRPSEDRQNF